MIPHATPRRRLSVSMFTHELSWVSADPDPQEVRLPESSLL